MPYTLYESRSGEAPPFLWGTTTPLPANATPRKVAKYKRDVQKLNVMRSARGWLRVMGARAL